MRKAALLLVYSLVLVLLACEVGPRSGRGLRLPAGDLARGEAVFLELGCARCHDVAGADLAPQGDRTGMAVVLGGEVSRIETHGQLVTSIINPSHTISGRYPRDQVAQGDESKMENFNERMTVAQLIDLTAFLQSTYERRLEPMYIP